MIYIVRKTYQDPAEGTPQEKVVSMDERIAVLYSLEYFWTAQHRLAP